MMQQVRLMMFSLNMVDYSMSFLSLYTWDFSVNFKDFSSGFSGLGVWGLGLTIDFIDFDFNNAFWFNQNKEVALVKFTTLKSNKALLKTEAGRN